MHKRLRHFNICSKIMQLDLNKFYSIRIDDTYTIIQGDIEKNKDLLSKYKFNSTDYGFLKAEVSKHIKIVLT